MKRFALASLTVLIATATFARASSTVRLHPIEAFTVVYEFEGMQSGTSTQHNRDWGHLRAEIQDTAMTMMGTTVNTKQRIVVRDDEIITIDLKKNTATKTKNPMYAGIVADVEKRGEGGEDLGKRMLRGMGGEPTGETGNYVGEPCEWWRVQQVGQRMCITADAITLRMEMNLGGMSLTQTATSVRRGDGGPDDAFDTSGVSIEDTPAAPDLSEILGE